MGQRDQGERRVDGLNHHATPGAQSGFVAESTGNTFSTYRPALSAVHYLKLIIAIAMRSSRLDLHMQLRCIRRTRPA
jgi:hypothetical protein